MKTIIIHLNTDSRGDVAWSIEQLLASPVHNLEKIHLGDDCCLFKVSQLETVEQPSAAEPAPVEISAEEPPAIISPEPALSPEEVPPQPVAPEVLPVEPTETPIGPCYVMNLSTVDQIPCFMDSTCETSKLLVNQIVEKTEDTISFIFNNMSYRYPCSLGAGDDCILMCGIKFVGEDIIHPCHLTVAMCDSGEPCKVVLGNDCCALTTSCGSDVSYAEIPAQ